MANKQKFVKVAEGDDWYGNYMLGDTQCFQVCLVKRDVGFVIVCQGDDDFMMVSLVLECHEAHGMFRKIKDNISQKQLKSLGFMED
jgi:hypothetical protein